MKILILALLLLVPTISYSDAGISVGYRSMSATITKNKSITPKNYYDTVNGVYNRTINVTTVNVFFDDSLKGHDNKGGEKDSIWPRWIRPSKGAGYIAGLNFSYGAEEGLVEYYSTDLYIGKRYFIIPHMLHAYFKIGPSLATFNYDMVTRALSYTKNVGGFYNLGFQVMVSKGIKFFGEAEFRAYSTASYDEFNLERNKTQFNNVLPGWANNYEETTSPKKLRKHIEEKNWGRSLITDGIRFGLKFTF